MPAIPHCAFKHVAPALALATLVLLVAGCSVTGAREAQAQEREQILFFPSLASVSPGNASWSVTIQGRVFEPAEGSVPRQAAIDLFAETRRMDRRNANYRKRAGWLLSDSVRHRQVTVRIGDRTFPLDPSGPAGIFRQELTFTHEEIAKLAEKGIIPFESVGTTATVKGVVFVVPPRGISVVTDMDDTIKDTNMLNHEEKMQNTFQRDFRAVKGMASLYDKWRAASGGDIQFHVVSAGPWQLYQPLQEFTETAGFTRLSWEMRTVPIRDPRVLLQELFPNLDRTEQFKVQTITALMQRFPARHFVLVGDSGERDPEAYAKILGKFPDRVDAVLIRNVHGTRPRNRPVASLFPGEDATKLHVFVDPDAVSFLTAPADLLPKQEK